MAIDSHSLVDPANQKDSWSKNDDTSSAVEEEDSNSKEEEAVPPGYSKVEPTVSTTDSTNDVDLPIDGDELELAVVQVNYSTRKLPDNGEKPVIHLFCRTPDGKEPIQVNVHGFKPYFHIPEREFRRKMNPDRDSRIIDTEHGHESIRGNSLVRVYTDIPKSVSQLRNDYDHYEADVLFPDRFLIDNGITSGIRIPNPNGDNPRVDIKDDGVIDVKDTDLVVPAETTVTPRIHTVDIEVEDRHGFPEPDDANEVVFCITAHDSFDDEYIVWAIDPPESDETIPNSLDQYEFIDDGEEPPVEIRDFHDEESLLVDYLSYVDQTNPDCIVGWNVGDFDATYLVNRLNNLNRDSDRDLNPDRLSRIGETWGGGWRGPNIKGRVVFDLLEGYKRTQFSELDSYRLDAIGEIELGVGKEIFDGKVGQLWNENPEKLIEYNLRDVEICVELDRQQEIIDFWNEVRQYVGCRLQDAPIPGDAVDMYVLHKVSGDYVLPSKGQHGDDGDDYEGGAVFEPVSGIVDNVTVHDLKSLYPMSMATINASPETKVSDDYDGPVYTAPNGVKYRKDEDGIMREMITELLSEREKKKELRNQYDPDDPEYALYDRQQASVKVIMNSLYGVSGWERFRLYDKDNAAAITATGREVIKFTDQVVQEMGYEVTYGDTDSVMVSIGPDITKEEAIEQSYEMEDHINERYQEFAEQELNAQEHRFQIEFEKLYKRFLQAGKKKRYAGHIVYKEGKDVDDIDITGFEYKRSDIAGITKEAQKRLIEMLVKGEDHSEVRDYLHDIITDFQNGEIPVDEVGMPSGIGKDLHDYENDTAHVRGAKYANLLFGTNLGNGSKPKRIYLSRVHPNYFTYIEKEKQNIHQNDIYQQFKRDPDVICFIHGEQIPEEFEVDWDKMLNKTLKKPLGRILRAIDIQWDEVVSGNKQTGIGSFM